MNKRGSMKKNEVKKIKKITMYDVEIDLPDVEVEKVVALGRQWIQDDKEALFRYAALKILREQIELME